MAIAAPIRPIPLRVPRVAFHAATDSHTDLRSPTLKPTPNMTHKPIETTFTANGFIHEQVQRVGDIALYRRFKQGGGQEHFEVVRIKRHDGFKIPGTDKRAEPAETYPSNEKWGVDGFTFPDKDSAQAKFDGLAGLVKA